MCPSCAGEGAALERPSAPPPSAKPAGLGCPPGPEPRCTEQPSRLNTPPGSTPLQPTPQTLLGPRDHGPLIQLNPCASQAPCSLQISLAVGLLGNGSLQLQPQDSPSPRETRHVPLCLSTCCPPRWPGERPRTPLHPRPQGCVTGTHYSLTGCMRVNKRWARRLQKAFS